MTIRRQFDVRISIPGAVLAGTVQLLAGAGGIALFAHGSGSSRLSPRSRSVAAEMAAGGAQLRGEARDRRGGNALV
jgi:hypothetical protein